MAHALAAAGVAVPVALLAALPGLVYAAGFDHLAYTLGLVAGVVIAGLLIAPTIAEMNSASIPQAIRARFGRVAAIVAVVIALLVIIPLLVTEATLVALVAEAMFGVGFVWAALAALVAASVLALVATERGFNLLAIMAFALLALSLIGSLFAAGFTLHGTAFPYLTFGDTLSRLSALEEKLLENGLVDFDTFSVHITPFLRLPQRGFVALVVSIALGTAVLLPLVATLARAGRPASVRSTGAWTAVFVMVLLMSVPPLAAYAKLEIYTAMTSGTPLANLPAWLVAPLDAGLATIHGTSPFLLEAVAEAARAGHQDLASVGDALLLNASAHTQWMALAVETREALLSAARSLVADPQAQTWAVYTQSVLPASATNAGNDAAVLSQAALAITPAGLLVALPTLFGAPGWLAAAIGISVIFAALVMAAALIRSLFDASGRKEDGRTCTPCRLALGIGPALLAAAITTLRIDDLATDVVSALSIGAAGLFPALALGLAWKRVTAAAAIAAMLIGGGTTLYYDVGVQAFPVSFYNTWAPLSNAAEFAIENFRATEIDAVDAESDEARAEAASALESLARGKPGRPGLANWFGIESASGAIFGVPLGLITLVLMTFLTGRKRRDQP
jgi:cation/acetate symporter